MSRVFPFPFTPEHTQHIRSRLQRDEVLAFPTETFYGLGGNAYSLEVVEQVFALKHRPVEKALLVLVAPQQMPELVVWNDPEVQRLTTEFWPGPLTVVLPASPRVPDFLRGPDGTLAVRHSPSPVVRCLLELGEVPLIGTSANLSGQPSCRSAEEVMSQLGPELRTVVDGGLTQGATPSTLLSCVERPFRILREGEIDREALSRRGYTVQ